MATIAILLKREDIGCAMNGTHLQITTTSGVIINLDPGAMEELKSDLKHFTEAPLLYGFGLEENMK